MRDSRSSMGDRPLGFLLALALMGLTACASVGPKTIPRDQFDYGEAIANSWKEQLLTNMMRLRYVEAPVFVNVSSVINQYSLEGNVALGVGANTSLSSGNTATLGGSARFTDKPTITYTPVSGKEFSISLLTPVTPEAIFALVQAGWAPEVILRLTVRSMNRVENASASPLGRRQPDPRFQELLMTWRRLREARALGLRRDEDGKHSRIVVYQTRDAVDPEVQRDLKFMREALELEPDAQEFTMSYGLIPSQPNEIAVLTCSMLELLNDLGWRADVPPEHVEEGRTGSTYTDSEGLPPVIRVHYAKERPADAYVAIRNRDYWFYIDDRDLHSKRTFAIMQILMSLTEGGEAARGPVVTIGS